MKIFVLFLNILCLGSFTAHSQEKLQYNLKVGDTFTVLLEATQEIKQLLACEEQIIIHNLSELLFFRVNEVTQSLYTLEVSFKEFSMHMSSPTLGEMMSINTNQETDDITLRMFQGMLNKPMEIRMTPTGEIIELLDGDTIINSMLETLGDLDEDTKQLFRNQLEEEWKAEALSESFEQITFLYPREAKSVGQMWQITYTGEGKENIHNTWIYNSKNDATRNLSGAADIVINLNTDAAVMKLAGKQTSQTIVSKDNGFVQKLRVESITSGHAVTPETPKINIPTTINSTTTYTLQ